MINKFNRTIVNNRMDETLSISKIRSFFPDNIVFNKYPVTRLDADIFFKKTDIPNIAKFIKQTMKNPNAEDIGRIICIAISFSASNQWNNFVKYFSVPFIQIFNKLKNINKEIYLKYLEIIRKKLQIIFKYPFFWCVHYSHIPNHLNMVNLKIALKDIDFVLLMFRQFPNNQEFKLWAIFYLCERNKIEKYHYLITDLRNILDKITIKTRKFLPYIWMTDRFCRQLDGKDFWNKFLKVDARITRYELKNPVINYYMSSYVMGLQRFWWKEYESLSDIQRYRIFTIYTPGAEEIKTMSEHTKLILIRCLYQGMAKSQDDFYFVKSKFIFDLIEEDTGKIFLIQLKKILNDKYELFLQKYPFLSKFIYKKFTIYIRLIKSQKSQPLRYFKED